jgi:hypothetical protein
MPLARPGSKQGALGVSIIRRATDDVPITPRLGDLREGIDYNDFGTDNDPSTPGNGQGNHQWDPGERLLLIPEDLYLASASDLAVMASYARQRGPHWAYGANLKFVRQSLPDTLPAHASFGAGIDGILYMPMDAVTIGATARPHHLPSGATAREKIWLILTIGASNFFPVERHALTLAVDLGLTSRTKERRPAARTADRRRLGRRRVLYRSTLAALARTPRTCLRRRRPLQHFSADNAASLYAFAADDPEFPDDTELDATHLVSLGYSWQARSLTGPRRVPQCRVGN